jgi:hypothetical protein
MAGYYPGGVTQDSFDREMERLGTNPRRVRRDKTPLDPEAFNKLRASLAKELCRRAERDREKGSAE